MNKQSPEPNLKPDESSRLSDCAGEGLFSLGDEMNALPYFKFMVRDWIAGDIQMCSHTAKGIAIDLFAKIWKKGGRVKADEKYLSKLLNVNRKRLISCLKELQEYEVIRIKGNWLYVDFLAEQIEELGEKHKKLSEEGRKGAIARYKPSHSQAIARPKQSDTDTDTESKQIKNKRKKYGEYAHVLLSDEEYKTLIHEYGKGKVDGYIKKVDEYVDMHGKPYRKYISTIRNWMRRDGEKKRSQREIHEEKLQGALDTLTRTPDTECDNLRDKLVDLYGVQATKEAYQIIKMRRSV